MAIIDALDYLSEQQTIKGTSYSTKAKYIKGASDFGQSGLLKYVRITAMGNATLGTGISFALLCYNKPDVTDAKVMVQTEQFTNAEVKRGFTKFLTVPVMARKYKYMCVKYVVNGGDEDETVHEDDICPAEPVLDPNKPVDNTYTAFITFTADTGVQYPYANRDKDTV